MEPEGTRGGDTYVTAVGVHRWFGAIGGHSLAMCPTDFGAIADGRAIVEIPESQWVCLGAPAVRACGAPSVVIEVDAVETIVVHHVGVQSTVCAVVDVLEEHAVQSFAHLMVELPTEIRTITQSYVSDVRNAAEEFRHSSYSGQSLMPNRRYTAGTLENRG